MSYYHIEVKWRRSIIHFEYKVTRSGDHYIIDAQIDMSVLSLEELILGCICCNREEWRRSKSKCILEQMAEIKIITDELSM